MDTFRYIITRACLQEGSLRLQRFLRPHFPAEGETVKLFDEGGHDYTVTVTGERLMGVGSFYRDHNLGVNDVVMITPLLPGCYKVEGIVKPYARPEPERRSEHKAERPRTEGRSPVKAPSQLAEAAPEAGSGVRVVVEATPHVREVRTKSPASRPSSPWASMERETALRAERASRYTVPPLGTPASEPVATPVTPERKSAADSTPMARSTDTRTAARAETSTEARVSVKPVYTPSAAALTPRAETELTQAREGIREAVRPPLDSAASVLADRAAPISPPPRPTEAGPALRQAPAAPRTGAEVAGGSASAASQRLLRDLSAGPEGVRRAGRESGGGFGLPNESPTSSGQPTLSAGGSFLSAQNAPSQTSLGQPDSALSGQPTPAEQLLESVSRRCGYRVDYPAPDLTRLRAELGRYSHTVFVATGGRAAGTAEWREASSGAAATTYRLWLTTEAQATADAPVVTHEALQQLAAQVQDAPFTPLDLRPFWEAGHLNMRAVGALAAQRVTERQQDAAFHAVLEVLAQQPAPSLVTAARLADLLSSRAGGDMTPTRLGQLLTLLTRSPYRLLSSLGEGNYLLEQDVPQYLLRLGQQFQGLSDAIRVAPANTEAAAADVPQSVAGERTWTAEEILRG